MPRKKRRSAQQIMEERSLSIVRGKLPEEWVIHQYAPDYGIDCVVETFEYLDETRQTAETLGELFLAQIKSRKATHRTSLRIRNRVNVELRAREFFAGGSSMDVISYPLDVDLLHTVMSVGYAMPVVLFLVDMSTEEVFFVCLTDYIEKILLHEKRLWTNETSLTINLPVGNTLDRPECLDHLAFLARRPKLFGAFNKFHYQREELRYDASLDTLRTFLSVIKSYDIWDAKPEWVALSSVRERLSKVEEFVNASAAERERMIKEDSPFEPSYDDYVGCHIAPVWDDLCYLSDLYEDTCKEWFLPTSFWCMCLGDQDS